MGFSVIMPTLRREHVIQRAIDSIIAQTYQDWELIVVDNFGSNYSFDDPRIRVFEYLAQRGACHARNFGVTLATKDLVSYFDDDDYMFPTYMERFAATFAIPGVKIARCMMTFHGQKVLAYGTPQVVVRAPYATPTWTSHPRHDQIYFGAIMEKNKWHPASPEFRLVNEILVQVRNDPKGGLRDAEGKL